MYTLGKVNHRRDADGIDQRNYATATPTAFVCSPYRAKSSDPDEAKAEVEANKARAKKACKVLNKLGYLPLAPHLYFTEFLNDGNEDERNDGIFLGLAWLEISDELYCFGDEITEGMSVELARAKELGIPIHMVPEPEEFAKELLEAILGGRQHPGYYSMERGENNE